MIYTSRSALDKIIQKIDESLKFPIAQVKHEFFQIKKKQDNTDQIPK